LKFGTTVFPHVLSILHDQPREHVELPLVKAATQFADDIGGRGARFTVRGEIRPASQQSRDQLIALADGNPRILDLEEVTLAVLEACLRFQTGPVWTDNTAESQAPGGTPFTLLGASTDYAYFSHREKFNKLWFDLQTLGSYGARTWEYSKGSGSWGTLTIDSDGAGGFTQDGTVGFTPPADWKQDMVNGVAGKYWVRVKVASVTTAAAVNQVQVNVVFNCIMLDPHFELSSDLYNRQPYNCTFLQKEDTS
jgi:hypothetical protein